MLDSVALVQFYVLYILTRYFKLLLAETENSGPLEFEKTRVHYFPMPLHILSITCSFKHTVK